MSTSLRVLDVPAEGSDNNGEHSGCTREKGIPPRTNARKCSWRELMAMRLYGRIIDEKLPLAAWRQNETPRSVIVYAVFHHACIC
jgi:hypothetical protein